MIIQTKYSIGDFVEYNGNTGVITGTTIYVQEIQETKTKYTVLMMGLERYVISDDDLDCLCKVTRKNEL